ncbi:MAG: V-type ATP synthase subunit F [Eubacteriales bacterium]|nr:V-type ATP synthase subunit F [Eubacteriales bacterium]
MYKIAVIGDADSIVGFASVGMDTYPVEGAGEAFRLIEKMMDDEVGIIFLTEELHRELASALAEYEERYLPAILPIPGAMGDTGYGTNRIRQAVERAIGTDMLFADEEAK